MRNFKLLIIYCALLLLLSPVLHAKAEESSERQFNILFISSYGYSTAGVPETLKGFEEGLDDLNVNFSYEFMDAQRFYSSVAISNFDAYLRYKLFTVRNFDLVAVADDPALRYAINNKNALFPNIPLVFMGINNITEAVTASAMKGATGIAESQDFENNYRLMKSLFPRRDNLVVIIDATVTGQGDYVEFMKFKDKNPDLKSRIINTSSYTKKGLKRALSRLGGDDIILFLDFSVDGDGNSYSLQNASDFLRDSTKNVPIFRLSSSDIGHGVFGGISYSFYDSGYIAGNAAKEILEGADPNEMPVMTATVTTPYFDQQRMDDFNIKYPQLPYGSVVINEHENLAKFYRENTLISNLTIIIALLMIIIILILNNSNKRRLVMMRTDFLTQMPNRMSIMELTGQVVGNNTPYGFIMVDVDKFKEINDTHGHKVGDEIIKMVAERLQSLADKDITFARLGGDEFCGLFYKPSKEREYEICEGILNVMKGSFKTSAGPLYITVSIGCAIYPGDTDNPEKLMECADSALYETKENGRNGYTLFDSINKP